MSPRSRAARLSLPNQIQSYLLFPACESQTDPTRLHSPTIFLRACFCIRLCFFCSHHLAFVPILYRYCVCTSHCSQTALLHTAVVILVMYICLYILSQAYTGEDAVEANGYLGVREVAGSPVTPKGQSSIQHYDTALPNSPVPIQYPR